MRIETFLTIGICIFLQTACIGFNFSRNNTWKIAGTNLSISVEKKKPSVLKNAVERLLTLSENYSDKSKIRLAPIDDAYSRINVYQISDRIFLIRDAFDAYELNTETKSLRKITPTDAANGKFIGAFDDNENGNWRFIPVSERGEIALGTKN